MGYAKYVGRVGALAFALGLGATVATSTPGIAFAEETEPDPNIGTNQPNEPQPDPAPNPDPDPTPPPAGEQLPSGENNQQQINNDNVQTTPSGTEVRSAEPGVVLNTGGYLQEEQKKEEKPVEPTGTTPPPPPPPPVVYVPPTPPVVTPKDQVIPQTVIDEKGKSKETQLQEEPGNRLTTTLNPELTQSNVEQVNGAQLRVTSVDENAEDLNSNGVMTMFSTTEDDNETMQTMAAAAAPAAPTPTLTSIFTGFLALVGLGPSTGAGTPSFPFVPTPIFDAIFAFVRRIESTLSNQTPTATVNSAWNPTTGQLIGQVEGDDEDDDTLTYTVSNQPQHGNVVMDSKTGKFTYTPDDPDEDPATWAQDSFTVTVSDDSEFHIHGQDESHTTEVAVKVLPPQAPTNPPSDNGTVTGQITGVTNPSGGPLTYDVQPQSDPTSQEQLVINPQTGTYTYTPSETKAHAAALDADGDGVPDSGPVTQTFTVVVTDQDGNQTPVTITLPVTPQNDAPEEVQLPAGSPPPNKTVDGVIYGTLILKDTDKDPVTVVGESTYGDVEILSTTFDEETGITTVEYKVTPVAQTLQEPEEELLQPFAFFGAMRMMSFSEPEPEGFSTFADESESFATLADPGIIFTVKDQYGGVQTVNVALPDPADSSASVGSADPDTGVVVVTVTATDAEGNPVTVQQTVTEADQPARGRVEWDAATNSWKYTPDDDARHDAAATTEAVTDEFTITITDPDGNVVPLTVTVPIDPDNATPTITPTGTPTTGANGVVTGTVTGTDPNSDGLTYTVNQPTTGHVDFNPATGTWTYTPDPVAQHNAAATPGADTESFTITVTDGHGGTATTTPISVPITPTNAAPTFTVAPVSTPADGPITYQVSNIGDGDGDQVTISVDQPEHGTVSIVGGNYVYTPTDTRVADTITFTATDAYGGITTHTVQVPAATATNVAPVVANVGTHTDPNTGAVTITVNATDPDGDPLDYTISGVDPAKGSLEQTGTNTWVYTPTTQARRDAIAASSTAAQRRDDITITVTDGQGHTTTAPASVSLEPGISADHDTVTTVVNGQYLGYVSSPDGERLYIANYTDSSSPGSVKVIDTQTNKVIDTIPTGPLPYSMAVSPSGDRLYVSNFGDGTVTVIDTTTNSVVGDPIELGGVAPAMVVSPDGTKLYASGVDSVTGENYVTVVDTTGQAPNQTIDTGTTLLTRMVVSPDGTTIYGTGNEAGQRGPVTKIDLTTSEPTVTTLAGSSGSVDNKLSPDGTKLYVTNADGKVHVYDTATGDETTTFDVGTSLYGITISPDGRQALVEDETGTIHVIDTATGAETGTIASGSPQQGLIEYTPNGAGAYLLTTGPGGSTLKYLTGNTVPNAAPTFTVAPVSTPADGPITYQVSNIGDGDGDQVTISVDQPEHGTVSIVGGNYVYTPTDTRVADTITFTATDAYGGITTHTVQVPAATATNVAPVVANVGTHTDPNTGAVTITVNATDPDGDPLDYTISGVDPAKGSLEQTGTNTWVYTPTTQARRDAIAASSTAAQRRDDITITVTDGQGHTTTAPASVSLEPGISADHDTVTTVVNGQYLGYVSSPDGERLYIANYTDSSSPGSVKVIDTQTNKVIDTIPTGPLPYSMAVSPSGDRLYVSNFGDGTVTVIDTTTNSVVGDPIELGGVAPAMVVSPDGTKLYASGVDSVTGENYVTVVDTTGQAPNQTIDTGTTLLTRMVVSPDGTTIYGTGNEAGQRGPVTKIDLTTSEPTVTTLAGSSGSVDNKLSPDGTKLYVTNADGKVHVYDTATGDETTTFDVGTSLYGITISPDGRQALVEDETGTIHVIDTATGAETGTIASGSPQQGLIEYTPNGAGAYLLTTGPGGSTLKYLTGNTVPNAAPTFTVAPVSTPADGPITYQVSNIGDGDGDQVTISVDQPEHGTVSIVGGNYVYTPTDTRVADTITFTATDAYGGITTHTVQVPAETVAVVVPGVDAIGTPVGPAVINFDKHRAYQVSYDANSKLTYVTVIDTDTGEKVNTFNQGMPGDPTTYTPQLSPNGEYLLVRAYDSDNDRTFVGIFDAEDGHPISGATLDGYADGTMTYHGNRAYQQASFGSYSNNNQKQSVAIFDAETGQALNTIQLDGGQPQLIFDDTISKAYFSTSNDTFLQETTRLLVLDQVTGTPVTEDPLVFVGRRQGMLVDEQTGNLYVTTTNLSVNPRATNVTTIDGESAEVISETGYFTGEAVGPLLLSADGVHAYQAVQTGYGPYSSEVKVIDLTTGEVEATPLVSSEGGFTQFVRDEDYPIAYLTTYDDNTKQTTIKTVSLESGDVLGTTTMDGNPYGQLTPTAAGGGLTYQATVQTVDNGDGTSTETTRYVFFDRESGLAVGPAVALNGYKQYEQRVGNQIYVSTYSYNDDTSHVYVIDADNGQLVGSSAASGYAQDPIVVKNGRGYLVTTEQNSPTVHILVVDMQTGQALNSNGPITIEPPSADASIHDRPTVQFPAGEEVAYVAVSYDNVDETITTHLISIDSETGELVTDQVFTSDGILVNSSYEPRNYMMYLTLTTADPDTFEMTTVYYEVDSYSGDLVAASTPTPGYGKLVFDGGEQALYLGSREFHIEDFGYSGYTLTPLQGQPGGPVFIPGDVASATVNPDNTLMYVLTNTNDEQSTVTVIDLYSGEVVGDPITISGQAIRDAQFDGNGAGGVVFDDAGNAYISTTTADGGTVITRIAAPDGSGFRMMTLGGESATPPSDLNVIYPEPEDTNPLLVEQFSSNAGDPAQFDMNSLLTV